LKPNSILKRFIKFESSIRNFILALLSAMLLVLLYPNLIFPNLGLPWLAPIALVPLLIALAREPRPLWRFLLGEFTGIVYWFAICYWIQFVLEVHGGMGRWGSWATFALFCVLKALHLALFSLLAAVLLGTRYAIPAIAALWTGIERTHGTFGFAWLTLGNAGIGMPLPLRIAPFVGVYGISFLFALMSAVVAFLILRRGRKHLYWLAAVPALLLLPDLPPVETPAETALVVQPNMPAEQEWTPASAGAERDHLIMESLEGGLHGSEQLVIWPESPGPLYFYRDPTFHREAMQLAQLTHAYFLFGTVAETPENAPLNSAVLLRPDGAFVDRYDKINLVPFGEYVPPPFGFVNRITQEISDFVPGNRIVIFPMVFPNALQRLGVFICYESVFPNEVREFVKGGANLLVNISNDGYFGHSAAREQHLEIARMRAVENNRWLIRSTNDGITAVIDPAGHIDERLPPYQELVAPMHFAFRSGTTLYTDFGDWFAWGCLIAGGIALVWSQRPNYTPEANRAGSQARPRP
jgi:apolipoprotein N-acyltransferase